MSRTGGGPTHPFYTNFTTGTVTEKLDSRRDFAKYQNGLRVGKNGVVLPQGGVASRAGTIFLGRAKFNNLRVRLVPFQFSVDQSYIIEFGEGYCRFWADRAPVLDGSDVPVEVETPYTVDDLRELRFEQSADVLYIGHPSYPPAKISRVSATEFTYAAISFFPSPTYEAQVAPPATLTLSQVSVGTATATASAAVFLAGDLDRQIRYEGGRAIITSYTSTTVVTVYILDAFEAAVIASGDWTLDGTANAGTLDPTKGSPRWATTTLTSSLAAFRSNDVGKYLYLHDGIVKITEYTSATVVTGQVMLELSAVTAAAAGAWTLESPSWSEENGYPGVPCLFQGRLWWAGSPSFRDTVWGSKTSDYENHARGALDSEAIVYQLATTGVNTIRWMKPGAVRGLALGTIAGEMTLDGGTDEPLTPTNVQLTERTRYGSDYTVDALKVDSQQIFLQRGATRIRELAYRFSNDDYASPDISILAENLFREAIVEMAHCSSPDSVLMALRDDGVLNLCTYEREQEVVAWTYAETPSSDDFTGDDVFESVAVIPNMCGDGDEVWVATQRTVGGGDYWAEHYWGGLTTPGSYWASDYWSEDVVELTVRYIEVFDGQMNTDSGLVWSGSSANTFDGLSHLEARVVRVVVANGTQYDLEVDGGQVVLPASTTSVEIGLPWTMTVVTVRPDVPAANGTIQGRRKRWNEITVRVFGTKGDVLLNDEAMNYPEGTDTTDYYSGDMKRKTEFGWDREGFITIQRADAKPCVITGITGALTVADD